MTTPFAEYLKAYREEHGLTQRSVGRLLGLEQQSISRWEKGLTAPDFKHIPGLVDLLGLDRIKTLELVLESHLELEKR